MDYLEKNFAAEARVESLSFKLPLNLEVKNFSCGDISFQKASIFGGFYNFFTQRLVLNSVVIDGVNLKITRTKDAIHVNPFTSDKGKLNKKTAGNRGFIIPFAFAGDEKEAPEAEASGQGFSLRIINFYIKNGGGELIDLTTKEQTKFTFKNTTLKIKNLTYPRLSKFNISLNTSFQTKDVAQGNTVDVSGWVDYFNKNMNVNVDVQEVNCRTFNDYYPNFWRPERFGVRDAILALKVNLNSQYNDLIIDGVLSLDKIDFVEVEAGDEKLSDRINYLRTILALLKGTKDKPVLNFKLKTKMDSPKLDFASIKSNFKGMVSIGAGAILGEVVGKAIGKEGMEKDIKKDVEDLFTGGEMNKTAETIKDVVDTFKDMFKK